jgi:hypothetical protein
MGNPCAAFAAVTDLLYAFLFYFFMFFRLCITNPHPNSRLICSTSSMGLISPGRGRARWRFVCPLTLSLIGFGLSKTIRPSLCQCEAELDQPAEMSAVFHSLNSMFLNFILMLIYFYGLRGYSTMATMRKLRNYLS